MKNLLILLMLTLVACTESDKVSSNKVSYKTEDIQALAKTVKANEIIMYGTSECMYCNQAKSWLNNSNFAFTDCDMYKSKKCERKYNEYKVNGTPLIVIERHGKKHIMRDGFDSDELLIALQSDD